MKCASFATGVSSIRTAAARRCSILVHCSWMTSTVYMLKSVVILVATLQRIAANIGEGALRMLHLTMP